jgi:hypothetical protein
MNHSAIALASRECWIAGNCQNLTVTDGQLGQPHANPFIAALSYDKTVLRLSFVIGIACDMSNTT